MNNRFVNAYRQAPWRTQVKAIGIVAAAVVFLALIAGIYLNVTARAATIGRQIQEIQSDKEITQQRIENLESQLARLTAASTMRERAEEMGFRSAGRDEIVYLVVPGYTGRPLAELAPEPGQPQEVPVSLPSEFTLSLIDWARELVSQVALQNGVPLEAPAP
ncbi:MAG: hypothetical protein DWQ07_06050 [Chloroflexi bacterium]|nr:MAG: hypothetical protein DWQ07_06050 [Chloroflexota bacterium]MBL1196732.1 hypothetical protein [Chloroflexota bacterium]NOH14026.1 hypothetical protein [Chloroflexota bacterium]